MHRFIVPHTDFHGKTLTLTDTKEIRHIAQVLRLKKGDEVTLFNGRGEEALAKIEYCDPRSVNLTIISDVKKDKKRPITLTLACAIPKKAKFETIIEKCTELGVDRIIPLLTQRTEVRLKDDKRDKKQHRYQSVAENAAKQCQRNDLPLIEAPTPMKDFLKSISSSDAPFIPCLQGERKNLLDAFVIAPHHNNIVFLIGPEGDFTTQELNDALARGCTPVSLGSHILKVDTAAISTIATAKLLIERIQP